MEATMEAQNLSVQVDRKQLIEAVELAGKVSRRGRKTFNDETRGKIGIGCGRDVMVIKAIYNNWMYKTRIFAEWGGEIQEERQLATIDSQALLRVLKSIKNQGLVTIRIEIEARKQRVYVSCKGVWANLAAETPIDLEYQYDLTQFVKVPLQPFFLSHLRVISRFAGNDDARPILGCLHVMMDGDSTVIEAANGYVLARLVCGSSNKKSVELLVPVACILYIQQIVRDDPFEMAYLRDKDAYQLYVRAFGTELLIREMKIGTYPDVSEIIPLYHKVQATVNSDALLNGLRTLNSLPTNKPAVARMHLRPGEMRIDTKFETNEISIEVPVEAFSGEDVLIGINARMMYMALQSMGTEQISIRAISPNTPVMFSEVDGDQPYSHLNVVIAPIYLSADLP